MRRLTTLGGLSLHQEVDGRQVAVSVRVRQLLVLAILSRCGRRGMPRELLKTMLWPESDAARAGQVLRQTLYALRRDAGPLVAGTLELRLEDAAVTADSTSFEALVAAQEYEAAVSAYGGHFLAGVTLKSGADLQFWVDRERDSLSRTFRHALVESARRSAAAGADEQVRRWTAASQAFPLDEFIVCSRVAAHLAVGDRVAALHAGEQFAERLRAELELEPGHELQALLARARDRAADTTSGEARPRNGAVGHVDAAAAVAEPTDSTRSLARAVQEGTNGASAAHSATEFGLPTAERRLATHQERRRTTRRAPRRGLAVAVVLLATAGVAWIAATSRRAARPEDRSGDASIAIFPARAVGSGEVGELADAVSRLLVSSLDGIAGIRIIDAGRVSRVAPTADSAAANASRSYGASAFVTTQVTMVTRGEVQLDATLGDSRGRNVAPVRVSVRGTEGALFALVDSLAREILVRHSSGSAPLGHAAARSTASLPALRAFLAGERQFREGKHAVAIEQYQRAIALDSTFAIAYYRLSEAADWVGNGDLMMDASQRAYRHRGRLARRDQLLVEATYWWREGGIDRSESLLRELVRQYPIDAEAWYQLGEVQFHSAPRRGRPMINARRAFETALQLDSTRSESLLHLARIAAHYGAVGQVESLAVVAQRHGATATTASLRNLLRLASGDVRALALLIDSLRATGGGDVYSTAIAALQLAGRPEVAAPFLALLQDPPHDVRSRIAGTVLMARLQLGLGHGAEAYAALRHVPNVAGRVWSLGQRAMLLDVPGAPVPGRAALVALRDSLRAWTTSSHLSGVEASAVRGADFNLLTPRFREYPLALVHLLLGDTSAANASARSLLGMRGDQSEQELARALASGVLARVALQRADSTAALQLLRTIDAKVRLYDGGDLTAFAGERLLLAQLLEARGSHAEALGWFESLGQWSPGEIAYRHAVLGACQRMRVATRVANRRVIETCPRTLLASSR